MSEALLSPEARADLIAQSDYFSDELGNPDLAVRFEACAEATFKKLARTPGLGRPRSFGNSRLQKLRSWKVDDFPKHLIFYRHLPDQPGVEILRVLHGARDLEAQFGT